MAEEEKPAEEAPAELYVKLTEEEHVSVIEHINRKAISPNDGCPVCGDPNNSVTIDTYRVDVLTKAPMLGGLYQPLYSTICNNCGFVRFFNRFIVRENIRLHEETLKGPAEPGQADGG